MKDFIIAEYKTIILVLLFCGGVFAWFYHRELAKDAAKLVKQEQVYTCMEPGKWYGNYKIGDPLPKFDDSWAQSNELTSNMVTWRHNGGDVVINAQNNEIRAIELYPKGELLKNCSEDFNSWTKNHQIQSEPVHDGNLTYSSYPGVVSIIRSSNDESSEDEVVGWVINGIS